MSETVVQECDEYAAGILQVQYNLVPITQVANIEPNSIIDVVGVCKEVGDLQVFTGKTNNHEFKKRDLTLVDTSNASVALTIWGDDAVNFDGPVQLIVPVKGGRVTEFNGRKTISLGNSSLMEINLDIPEAHKLWMDG